MVLDTDITKINPPTNRPNLAATNFPVRRQQRRISPLTFRILAVNIVALIFLGGGVLYVDQLRDTLVQSRIDDLIKDGEVMAGAIGESAAGGPESSTIELVPARQIILRLVSVTQNRTRFFNTQGALLLDTRDLAVDQVVSVDKLPPEGGLESLWVNLARIITDFFEAFNEREQLEQYREVWEQKADQYPEVLTALGGEVGMRLRRLDAENEIITIAVPIQRFRRVLGALMISADTHDINEAVQEAHQAIVGFFLVALLVTLALSVFLARTIVRPIKKLAGSADRIRLGLQSSTDIPDFSARNDEVGDLSASLRDMTNALARQIDAVANFAADVAHELKNPLTSLRSAVETLDLAKTDEAREKLTDIILHDVHRLDRLISDISNASKLDAEMSRAKMETVNLTALLQTLINIYDLTGKDEMGHLHLEVRGRRFQKKGDVMENYFVRGLEGQLGQLVQNLIDNAISFSNQEGNIYIRLGLAKGMIRLEVEDEGVGIPQDKLEDIFDRFYSERPSGEAFGKHSGLGLSICRQIVEAHGGKISAKNRKNTPGACFTVLLPADKQEKTQ